MASNSVVALQEQIKKELAEVRQSVPAPTGNQISTNGKVFAFPSGQRDEGPILAVILDHRNFNAYYSKPYNPQNITPPECFAISKQVEGMVPHEKAETPQSDACEGCPRNEWGSSPTGRGKACNNTIRLAIVAPDATADDEPMILRVSPTGLKGYTGLVNGLQTNGMLPIHVVTEVSFKPEMAQPSLNFKVLKPHDKLELFWKLREKAQSILDAPPSSG